MMHSDSELNKFIYLCINLMMIVVGAMLSRRVFAVFGGIGAAGYLGHLAYDVFKDSMMFPFVLTIMGLVVICLGIVWQRHEEAISNRLRALLPLPLRELIERRHLPVFIVRMQRPKSPFPPEPPTGCPPWKTRRRRLPPRGPDEASPR